MTRARDLADSADKDIAGTVTLDDIILSNDITLADNGKAIFGAGSDLQIYHSGAASFISDQGTGNLKVLAQDFAVNNPADSANMITAAVGGAVTVFHNGGVKLATSSTGISVTGTAVTDGLTVAGNLSVNGGTIKLDGNYPVGTGNVALGDTALDDGSLSGDNNTAVGSLAMTANTTGTQNAAFGQAALDANTTGSNNTALGRLSVSANSTGSNNTGVGHSALASNTTASNNTAVGYQAGYSNTTGVNNAYFGIQTGYSVTTGQQNSFLGQGAGYYITTGSKNVIVGTYSGNQGGLDIRTSSNYIVLSDGDGNPRLFILGNGQIRVPEVYNTSTGNSANMFVDSFGKFFRSTSSLKYKNTVNDATHGLTELLTLRPVTYRGNSDGDTVFGGLIAEEVHDAGLTEFVQYDTEGNPDALAYGNMVSLCIKAIQEQQATIQELEARITALENA